MPAPGQVPGRDLELASYLSRFHGAALHDLSASDCQTMSVAGLVALAEGEDRQRWAELGLGYTHPLGADWLRDAASCLYEGVAPADLICFAGAQEALYAVLQALLTPADHAIVVLPSYQSMETLPLAICAVSGIALDVAEGWALHLDALAAAIRPNTRLIIISFPNNPTGKQLEGEKFAALVALCRHHGIWLLSDEVYRLTEYDPSARLPAAADAYERGISLGAMSKSYGMPGLRIAWVACRDPALIAGLGRLRQYLSTCSAGPSEVLAAIALHHAPEILARNRSRVADNLVLLQGFLARQQHLFDCRAPEGGMVCYPHYKGCEPVAALAARLAEQAGVLVLPAAVFRSELVSLPAQHLRIGFGRAGFAVGLATLEAALG